MGVSGCGKSTLGQAIAHQLQWSFVEGDDLHPETNRQKMASGQPLNDEDRLPWLQKIRDEIDRRLAITTPTVMTCSALRRSYREILQRDREAVAFVYLHGERDALFNRLLSRPDHFFKPELLDSQLATLEPPRSNEAITLSINMPLEAQVEQVIRQANLQSL